MITKYLSYLNILNEEISFNVDNEPKTLEYINNGHFNFMVDHNKINVRFRREHYFINNDDIISIYEREYHVNNDIVRAKINNWKPILEGISYLTKKFIIDNNLPYMAIIHIRTSKDENEVNRRAELNKYYLQKIAKDLGMEFLQFKTTHYNTTYSVLYKKEEIETINKIIDYVQK